MDIDIILEADVSPTALAELAAAAEGMGIRALWSSNYHQNWDAFMALMPAALATSRIRLGALAVSPWEMHPLKMANALLTLNETSKGRAMVGISGGGGVLGALGWHIKPDRAVSMYEARRELIWRGAVAAKYAHELRPYCHDDHEVQLVIDNWDNLFKAFWTRSGEIEGLPADLVNRLIAGLSSAGDLNDLDRELERLHAFASSGLTELALRLFDEPMAGLELIGRHVLPSLGQRETS